MGACIYTRLRGGGIGGQKDRDSQSSRYDDIDLDVEDLQSLDWSEPPVPEHETLPPLRRSQTLRVLVDPSSPLSPLSYAATGDPYLSLQTLPWRRRNGGPLTATQCDSVGSHVGGTLLDHGLDPHLSRLVLIYANYCWSCDVMTDGSLCGETEGTCFLCETEANTNAQNLDLY